MENDFLSAALEYAEKHKFSVIPIRPTDKKPFIKWSEFQTRRATSEEIRELWRKFPTAMIGIVTGEISNIFVIDCDTLEGYQEIQKLIPDALILPVARTPRGGWHLYFVFPPGSGLTTRAGVMKGVDVRAEGGYIIAPPSVNGEGKGYAWEEGLSLDEVAPPTVPSVLKEKISLYAYRTEKEKTDATGQNTTKDDKEDKYFHQGRRDSDIFHAGNLLVKGGGEIPFITYVLKTLALNSKPPFPENEIQAKIESAIKRSETRKRNIAAEVRRWCEATEGDIDTTTCYKELQLTTKDDMEACRVALRRMCEEADPIIERRETRRGSYRRIDKTIEFMDFANADTNNFVDLRLPLGLHNKTKIFPKGAIVVAGVSGMGKTLFCLNAIAENMGRMPIFYFNSEMSREALKEKLSYFPIPISEWRDGMRAVDNWDFANISDKIQPDALNVIDYLEPEGDKSYNIHAVISAIIRRLNKGTAIISIQKKPGTTYGTGGVYSIKAATMALSLEWGKIEITKNRFREADQFPSLNKINFEIHRGNQFVNVGGWYK